MKIILFKEDYKKTNFVSCDGPRGKAWMFNLLGYHRKLKHPYMDKNLTKEDEKLIKSIILACKLSSGKDLSFEGAVDLLKVTDLLLKIGRGGFVCSKCGETQYLYEVRP